MKSLFLLSVVAIAALGSGCTPAPLTKADVDGLVVCNVDWMDQVERQARLENKEIHWVHCPQAVLRAV